MNICIHLREECFLPVQKGGLSNSISMTRLRNKTQRRPQRRDIRLSDNAEPQLKPKIKVIIKVENLKVISFDL
jgi:hypothetical protein